MSMENAKRLKTIIIVTGVLILAVLSFVAVEYTSQTGFCNSCHEMNTAFTGWQNGFHQSIHCYECHTDEGFVAKVKVKANGLREVYIHLTQEVNMDEVKTDIPEQRCVICHDFNQKGKYVERIVNFHKQHQEYKFGCLTCHGDVGHSTDRFIGFKNEACKQCHETKKLENPPSYIKKI